MKNLICKLFGHKIVRLNTKRMFAWCDRCDKGLKVSYDMTYGETIVTGDYGSQRTFCWCDCGNELCSTDSLVKDEAYVEYKCSKCGKESKWDFDTPVPIEIRKNPKGWNGWEYEFHYDYKGGRKFERGFLKAMPEDQANDTLKKHSSEYPNSTIVFLKEIQKA